MYRPNTLLLGSYYEERDQKLRETPPPLPVARPLLQEGGEGDMANEHLATYLNDHLAGATAAVEQRSRVEEMRLEAARTALVPGA